MNKETFKHYLPNIYSMVESYENGADVYFKYFDPSVHRIPTKSYIASLIDNCNVNSDFVEKFYDYKITEALDTIDNLTIQIKSKIDSLLYNNYIEQFWQLLYILESNPTVIANISGIGKIYFKHIVMAVYNTVINTEYNEETFNPEISDIDEIPTEIPEVINDLHPTNDEDLVEEIPSPVKRDNIFIRIFKKLFKL